MPTVGMDGPEATEEGAPRSSLARAIGLVSPRRTRRGNRETHAALLARSLVVPRVFFSFSIVVTATARRIATDVHPTILVR